MSINELMMSTVAPATDALWGVEDPQTDADWAELDAAAREVIAAFEQVKRGGTGPSDANWAAQPQWQEFSDQTIEAGRLARRAISNRDLDELLQAGDVLYPPCEACHLIYHPGVAPAE